jgi:GxxExxY protein
MIQQISNSKDTYLHTDLTGKIIGAAMKVHRELGNGFQEVLYQRALEVEFKDQGILFEREKEMDVYYSGELIGQRRADFLVEGVIIVELKAVSEINADHWSQVLNYLKAYKMEVGLLINFGRKSLEFKRFAKTQ